MRVDPSGPGAAIALVSEPTAVGNPERVSAAKPGLDARRGAVAGAVDVFSDFQDWSKRFRSAGSAEEKAALEKSGQAIALKRREAMLEMLQADPARALQLVVPYNERKFLPASIDQQLEQRVSAMGDFEVRAITPQPGAAAPESSTRRVAVIDSVRYRAFVYGRRVPLTTKVHIPLHGIVVGDAMAVHESPVRELEPGEPMAASAASTSPASQCAVCEKLADAQFVLDVGGNIVRFCGLDHKTVYRQGLEAAEKRIGPKNHNGKMGAGDDPNWTFGLKKVLLIRANFPNDTSEFISAADAQTLMDGVQTFFFENSYGLTRMTSSITPLLTMPQTTDYYKTNQNGDDSLLADARAAAKTAGFDTAGYDLDAVIFTSIFSWGGLGFVGAKGAWLQSTGVGTAVHELGHNYGLQHANFWSATGDTVIGSGTDEEYGNIYDTMGDSSTLGQFGSYNKNLLGWIPTNLVQTITTNGLYRLYPFDVSGLTNGFSYALKINKDSERDYWVEMRQQFTNNVWLQNGVLLTWSPWSQSRGGTELLDTTPGSPAGKNDAGVVLGRTFSDTAAAINITPVAKSTTPYYIDVVVNLGAFPGNLPPVVALVADAKTVAVNAPVNFTATATDPNGDTVAYYWDFGDQTVASNSSSVSHAWTQEGNYVVRCTASDMKGGVGSTNIVVTVGAPTTFSIAGRVTLQGNPVEGVRIFVSADKDALTDSSGNYTVTALPAGPYDVNAVKPGYTLAPLGFSNPVSVGPNATDINFSAALTTYTVSGKVTDNGVPVADVVVTDGTRTNATSSAGIFTLAGVPAGGYDLVATKTGYDFAPKPQTWTNPVRVEGNDRTNLDFVRVLFPVTGTVSGPGDASTNKAVAVTIGDNLHEVSAPYNPASGLWEYSLPVPGGQWTLQATLAGYTITSANFTNPIVVLSNGLSDLNFNMIAAVTVVTDQPPTITLTAPTNGQRFIAPSDLVLNAGADDADGTVNQVLFYQGTNLVGTATNNPYTLSWTNVPAGAYVLTAVAVDNAGLSATSAPVNVTFASAPDNDNFANAAPITGTPTNVTGSNLSATKEPGEPNHGGNPGGQSVWWSWIAPRPGLVTISTAGSGFNTLLAVYTGNSVSTLTPIASDDGSGASDGASQTIFNALVGTNYWIAVDGKGVQSDDGYKVASGNIMLNLTIAAPTNNVTAPSLMVVLPRPADGFQLKLVGQPGAYDIQSTTNLADWIPLGRFTNVAGETLFVDPTPVDPKRRFYRAVSSP